MIVVKIYALISSLDDSIFYIGATTQTLKFRLSGHVCKGIEGVKSKFIQSILKNGGSIEILELDAAPITEAAFYEQFYYDLFRSFGFNLIQRPTTSYTVKDKVAHPKQNGKIRKLINVPDEIVGDLKKEAEKEGRSLKKHIEYLLEKHALKVEKKK